MSRDTARTRNPKRLAATQIAGLGHCEYKVLFDRTHGETVTPEQQLARTRGNQEHARFHRIVQQHHNAGGGQPSGAKYCFIATQVLGSEHPRTYQLRRFRDRCLRPYAMGRWVTARYYRVSPAIAEWLSGHPKISRSVGQALEGLCRVLTPWTE